MGEDAAIGYPTMLSSLIQQLVSVLAEKGDMPVAARSPEGFRCAKVTPRPEPRYWDGGVIFPTEDTTYAVWDWVRGKHDTRYASYCLIDASGPERPFADDPPEERRYTIDGVPLEPEPEG